MNELLFSGLRRFIAAAVSRAAILPMFSIFFAAAHGQSVSFNGAIRTLGSGLNQPYSIAIDSNSNVYLADSGNNAVKEILAVNGTIPASNPTIRVLGSGFSHPDGVAVDGNGDVFVADSGNNAVKEMLAVAGSVPTSNPTINILGSGFNSPLGVAVDVNGNVFVADTYNSAVKEILKAGGYTTINTLGNGFNRPAGVAVDANENVFVADSQNSAVKEIVAAGGYTTVNTLSGGFSFPGGIAVDANDNVFVADTDNNAVKEILASGGYTAVNILGSGFSLPNDVALDGSGNVFVADTNNNAAKELSLAGGNFGQVNVGSTGTLTLSVSFLFNSPGTLGSTSVLTQGAPNLDFSDAGSDTCTAGNYTAGQSCVVNVKLTPAYSGSRYGAVELLDGSGNLLATGYVQGIGVGPQITFANTTLGNFAPSSLVDIGSGFSAPTSVAVDAAENIYVADEGNGEVEEYLALGGYSTFNILGSGFSVPYSVAVDGAGNVFVADFGNDAVYEIQAAGGYVTVNSVGSGYGFPLSVAVDGVGNAYVADLGNNAIYQVLAAGGYTTVNSIGNGFTSPEGVAADGSGNVFVADTGNNAVEEILASGGYTTVNLLGSGFNGPLDVAVDGNENVFVADSGNSAVKEILASGGYTTINTLGSGFNDPAGVAVDGSGNVFVADEGFTTILDLTFSSAPSYTFASTAVGFSSSDSPQTITLTNDGNAALTFALNPSISSNFALGSSQNCPAANGELAAFTSCNLPINFTPIADGSILGQLTLTDNNLYATNATQTLVLNGFGTGTVNTSTALSSALNPSTYGQSVTITATVSPTSGTTTPVGAVQFSVNGAPVGGAVALTNGAADFTSSSLTVGADSVTAAYTPSVGSAFISSSASPLIQTINQATPSITWATPAAINYGVAVSATQLNATATYNSAPVAGTFTYTPPAGTFETVGTQTLSVLFTPNDSVDYTTATGSVMLVVNQSTPVITWATPAAIPYGVALSATQLNATASYNSTSVAGTYTYTPPTGTLEAVGTQTLSVLFTPNDSVDYTTATGSTTLIVNQATTTTSLSSTVNPVFSMNPTTLTATISSALATPTSGTVVFLDGTTPIGSGTLNSSGQASITMDSLSIGVHSLTASYGGSTDYASSVSPSAISESVEDFTIQLTSGTLPVFTIGAGGSATYSLTVSPLAPATSFPETISMSASGGPAGTTFAFSPATIQQGSGTSTVNLTVQIPSTTAALGTQPQSPGSKFPVPLALSLVLLPLASKLRRAGKRVRRMMVLLLLLIAGISSMIGLSGCGSIASPNVFSITVTGGVGLLNHSTDVTVIVK